jgi:hypothetical protein
VQCSAFARAEHLDPIGTAGSYRAFLLVEWPLPWPPDLASDPRLSALRPALAGAGARLQALVAPQDSGVYRVILYSYDGKRPFSGYRRTQRTVPPDEVVATAEDLLTPSPGGSPLLPDPFDEAGVADHDVLVCTHGRRDRCCGSSGTELSAELMAQPLPLGARTRVWRTSHTGGHRFAPTAIILPEGTAWGYLDSATLRAVVERDQPPGDLLAHYRGCAGLPSASVQAVERAVIAATGWDLLDRPRHGHQTADGQVRFTVEGRPGAVPPVAITWEAQVDVARQVPVIDCGAAVELSRKYQPELAVHGLRRVT